MHVAPTRLVLPLVALFAALSCSPDGENTPDLFPVGAGIQENLLLTELEAGGWTVCFEDTYAGSGTQISSILSGCQGTYMMIACGERGSDSLALAAADARSVVIQPDDGDPRSDPTIHHVSNGVAWYFNDAFSWGFFPEGAGVNRDQCDIYDDAYAGPETLPELRLCWHSYSGTLAYGYRCGPNELTDDSWRRLVLVR